MVQWVKNPPCDAGDSSSIVGLGWGTKIPHAEEQLSPSNENSPVLQLRLSSVQLPSRVQLFATLWTAACQSSLSITNSWSLLKVMSMESVMPSNHLISLDAVK